MGEVRVNWTAEDSARLAANQQVRDHLQSARELTGRLHVRELLAELIESLRAREVDMRAARNTSGWRPNQCGQALPVHSRST